MCLTLQGRAVRGLKAEVADGGVGLEADEHGPLSGLQPGGGLGSTKGPQQRRAGGGAVPHLEDRGHDTMTRHALCDPSTMWRKKAKYLVLFF